MEPLDLQNLAERTRHRERSTWVALDWGGLMTPLADTQADLNMLGMGSVENYLAISDETWGIKSLQRDKADEFDRAEIAQLTDLAGAKAAMEREKLAIRIATDEYVLAARVYDAKVRALLMGAREYAAQVEIEQLEVDRQRALLAVEKERLRGEELNAQVYYEILARAQVEVEIARAQVDVAKAHVRALMADIEASRAGIELVEAETQKYVAMAEKATLMADVASIFAEIATKQLSAIKLDVGRKEIEAGFGYLQSKLDDMLALWGTRTFMEKLKAELEVAVQSSIQANLAADKAAENLKEDEVDNARKAFTHEVAQTQFELSREEAIRQILVNWRKMIQNARLQEAMQRDNKQTWAQALVNKAQKGIYAYSYHGVESYLDSTELISGE